MRSLKQLALIIVAVPALLIVLIVLWAIQPVEVD